MVTLETIHCQEAKNKPKQTWHFVHYSTDQSQIVFDISGWWQDYSNLTLSYSNIVHNRFDTILNTLTRNYYHNRWEGKKYDKSYNFPYLIQITLKRCREAWRCLPQWRRGGAATMWKVEGTKSRSPATGCLIVFCLILILIIYLGTMWKVEGTKSRSPATGIFWCLVHHNILMNGFQ